MVTREIGDAMLADQVKVVVITSGDLVAMKQFATKLKGSGKKLVVFMTWESKHPGNHGTPNQYTSATQRAIKVARQMEKETGATIVPVAVLYHDLTIRPPQGMPRVDYLWKKGSAQQNALGNLASALLLSAILTGEKPAGLNFDVPPQIVGQRVQDEPDLRLTRELRDELQYRAWAVAQAWARGKSHLE